jgi:viroplasmin and RNaseH domain-containing protein
MMTLYVVYQGKRPGVYDSWPLCCDDVARYSNNCYKGFKCKEVVASFLEYTGSEDFSMEENAVSTPSITDGGQPDTPKEPSFI